MLKIFAIVMCTYFPNGDEQCQPIIQSTFPTLAQCELALTDTHYPRVFPRNTGAGPPPVWGALARPEAEIFCASREISVWQRAK
jgi:hypothetical protein